MVMMLISITALCAAVSLVLDVANLYIQYLRLQSASDAAALAGAAYLPAQSGLAPGQARSYALSNGIQATEIQNIIVAPDNRSIVFTGSRNVAMYFAAIVGVHNLTVTSSSKAGVQPAGANIRGVLPLGLDNQTTYYPGQAVILHGGKVGPGNWQGLALGGTGATNFQNNIENGYSGTLSIGDSVSTEPGAKSGPTSKGVTDRVTNGLVADPGGTATTHSLDDPRAVVIPLVNWSGVSGSTDVTITGFVEVWLVAAAGADVTGIFIEQVIDGAPSPGAPDGGTLHVSLLR